MVLVELGFHTRSLWEAQDLHAYVRFFFGVEEFYFRIKFLATEILHMANIWAIVLCACIHCTVYAIRHTIRIMYARLVQMDEKKEEKCKQNVTICCFFSFLCLSEAMTAIVDFHVCRIYLANKHHNSILGFFFVLLLSAAEKNTPQTMPCRLWQIFFHLMLYNSNTETMTADCYKHQLCLYINHNDEKNCKKYRWHDWHCLKSCRTNITL